MNVTEGTVIRINEASLERKEAVFTCPMTSFDCLGRNCTANLTGVDLSDYPFPWVDRCVPLCGMCRNGFECLKVGMCKPYDPINTRSASVAVGFVLAGLLVLWV